MKPILTSSSILTLLFLSFPAAAQAPAATEASADLAVVEATFANRVEAGEPADRATTFAPGSRVVYHLRVRNTGNQRTLTLVWIIDGRETLTQTLDVGRSWRWRTWANGRASGATGNTIEVQVKDEQGTVLRTDRATIGDPSAAPAAAPAPAPAPAPAHP